MRPSPNPAASASGQVREPLALIERELTQLRARTGQLFGVNLIPAGDTRLIEDFHINWSPHAAVRVLASGVRRGDPFTVADHITIGEEKGRPIYLFSTDSPLRSMTGYFEAMALTPAVAWSASPTWSRLGRACGALPRRRSSSFLQVAEFQRTRSLSDLEGRFAGDDFQVRQASGPRGIKKPAKGLAVLKKSW